MAISALPARREGSRIPPPDTRTTVTRPHRTDNVILYADLVA
ncbi:hypothetical protein [Streptomyces sp. RerS4]|nr:hypothetical protein [Streptomyces sp. RerS4]